jgi:hypothetical protein
MFERLVKAVDSLVPLLISAISSVSLRIAALMRAGYGAMADVATAGRSLAYGAIGVIKEVSGYDVLVSQLWSRTVAEILILQGVILASVVALFLVVRYRGIARRNSLRMLLQAGLVIVAVLSFTSAMVRYPAGRVSRDVTNLSDLVGADLVLESERQVEVVLPRNDPVERVSIWLESDAEMCPDTLFDPGEPSESRGFALSDTDHTAFGFRTEASYPLESIRIMVGALSAPRGAILLTGRPDSSGRPGEDVFFTARVVPVDLANEPKWVEFKLERPFLFLKNEWIWIVLLSEGDSEYVWWSLDEGDLAGTTIVRGDGDWSPVEGSPVIDASGPDTYVGEVTVDAGRMSGVWSRPLDIGDQIGVDLTQSVMDYVDRAPENFRMVGVPVTFSSDIRMDLKISDASIVVAASNPDSILGAISILISLGVVGICTYFFLGIRSNSHPDTSAYSGFSPVRRKQLSSWEYYE